MPASCFRFLAIFSIVVHLFIEFSFALCLILSFSSKCCCFAQPLFNINHLPTSSLFSCLFLLNSSERSENALHTPNETVKQNKTTMCLSCLALVVSNITESQKENVIFTTATPHTHTYSHVTIAASQQHQRYHECCKLSNTMAHTHIAAAFAFSLSHAYKQCIHPSLSIISHYSCTDLLFFCFLLGFFSSPLTDGERVYVFKRRTCDVHTNFDGSIHMGRKRDRGTVVASGFDIHQPPLDPKGLFFLYSGEKKTATAFVCIFFSLQHQHPFTLLQSLRYFFQQK